jgi:Domain of unknown function DUF29
VAVKAAPTEQLYEKDFALWLEEQALALKERRAAELDWDNLAAEIEGLVRSDRRALKELFAQRAASSARTRLFGLRAGPKPTSMATPFGQRAHRDAGYRRG